MSDDICIYCGGPKSVRNPTGNCDHLYWPDMIPGAAKNVDRASELAAARNAALEEAAAHLDWRQEATRMAGVKCKEIGSDDDAVRYNHYSQAHEAAAAAIRELKDK